MLWAIIMAGGQGTRLWPASRRHNPKQFLKLFGKKSLIESTIRRVSKVVSPKRIFIITDSVHLKRTRKLFPKIPASQVIGEPVGRNTAATVGLGAFLIYKKDPEAVCAVFPSDQLILDEKDFSIAIRQAADWAKQGPHHVVFGIRPAYPATAYGYVERKPKAIRKNLYCVKRFVEKPRAALARKFFKSSRYYWQAGIFVWGADTILDSFRRYLPVHFRLLSQIVRDWKEGQTDFSKPHLFTRIPKISVDYGIMEKLKTIYVMPAPFGWDDVGSWKAVESVWSKDADQNASLGHCIFLKAKENLVFASPGRLICLIGVHNLAVVDTKDALLVASKHHSEQIKDLVQFLKKRKYGRYL